jgi:phosphoribosyl 1,2-cyclic phosphate phosphodiesterase
LNPVELCWRRRGYSKVTKPLTVIGPPTVFHAIMAQTANSGVACDFTELQLHRVEVSPGREITDGDMTILPIAANHAPGKAALVYVFRRNGKSLLIANDTGWLTDESWEVLRSQSLDAAVIECTSSLKYPDQRNHHMGANTTVAFRDQLRNIGCLKPDAIVVTNHFSHNGNSLHQVLEDFFVPKGIAVAYDGMVITF